MSAAIGFKRYSLLGALLLLAAKPLGATCNYYGSSSSPFSTSSALTPTPETIYWSSSIIQDSYYAAMYPIANGVTVNLTGTAGGTAMVALYADYGGGSLIFLGQSEAVPAVPGTTHLMLLGVPFPLGPGTTFLALYLSSGSLVPLTDAINLYAASSPVPCGPLFPGLFTRPTNYLTVAPQIYMTGCSRGTLTWTPAPTSTATPSPTVCGACSPSFSPSSTPVVSSTSTATPDATSTISATITVTRTPILVCPLSPSTSTPSPTATPSRTATPTASATPTATPSRTATPTASATPTATPSRTATPTPTPSFTPGGVPASSFSGVLSVDGAAGPGQQVLYYLDYSISSDTNNGASLPLPACASILSASPQPYNGATAVIVGNTVTWRLPDATAANTPPYLASGRAWVLVQLDATCGSSLTCSANLTSASLAPSSSNSVALLYSVGSTTFTQQAYDAAFTAIPNGASVADGATIHYVLNYSTSGPAGLSCFEPFDADTFGSFSSAGAGAAFGSWSFGADSSAGGIWTVGGGSDGNRLLAFSGSGYMNLLYSCPVAAANGEDFCGGEIVVDVRHDDLADANGDVGVVLREDGQLQFSGYGFLLSGDTSPGPGTGHLILQRAQSGSIIWPVASTEGNTVVPVTGSWYTIKALEVPGQPGHFMAKWWLRGSPEPASWAINWTDPTPLPCGSAGDGKVWRPGLQSTNASASYDNFRVLGQGNSLLQVWDSIPLGLNYVSASPAPGLVPANSNAVGDLVAWSALLPSGASGAFTWTGVAVCAEAAAAVNSASASYEGGSASVASTNFNLLCNTYSPTPTPTPCAGCSSTPSATPSGTATPSVTPTLCGACTATITPTSSATLTPSPTATPSPTKTVTPSSTPTSCGACTATVTKTPVMFYDVTFTANTGPNYGGNAVTITASLILPSTVILVNGQALVSPTYINSTTLWAVMPPGPIGPATVTVSDPNFWIYNNVFTNVYSYLGTGVTPTGTLISTVVGGSPTATLTVTRTPTRTSTNTPTNCGGCSTTATSTVTSTPTYTATNTPTNCAGCSATLTLTATPTVTRTLTATLTVTPTNCGGCSATLTPTATLTVTCTPTRTPTATPSFTSTASITMTPTRSVTRTASMTASLTVTPTVTMTSCGLCQPSVTATPTQPPTTLVPVPVPTEGSEIFPSPVRGSTATLAFMMPCNGRAKALVLDARGRLTLTVELPEAAGTVLMPVNVAGLRRGIYFYKIILLCDDGTRRSLPTQRFAVLR